MYRHNGGILGKQAANTNIAVMMSIGPRGRKNGSIIDGSNRLVDHLEGMVPKVSGIWRLSGMQLVDEDVDTVTYVDNSYWTDPPPYQQFVETSRSVVATGNWYPGGTSCSPCGSMWGCSGDQRNAGNAGSSWTTIGSSGTASCSNPWVYAAWNATGYYQTVDPPAYYTEQIDATTTTTTHKTWNFFC